jgi:hypothetical protein
MPAPDYPVRSYAGAAPFTTLSAAVDGTTTTIPLSSTASWFEVGTTNLLGTSGAFVVALDFGQANEEKIYCPAGSISGSSLTNVVRGYEGGATSHATGTTSTHPVAVVFSATEAKEANRAAVSTSLISGNTGTTTTPSAIGVAATAGISKYAAAADHAHDYTNISNVWNNPLIGDTAPMGLIGNSSGSWYDVFNTTVTGYTTYIWTVNSFFDLGAAETAKTFYVGSGTVINSGSRTNYENDLRSVSIPTAGNAGLSATFVVSAAKSDSIQLWFRVKVNKSVNWQADTHISFTGTVLGLN